MADGIEVRLEGAERVLAKLGRLSEADERLLRREVARSSVKIEADAKELAPNSPLQPPTVRPSKSTGQLRGDIRHELRNRGLQVRIGTSRPGCGLSGECPHRRLSTPP